MISVACCNIGSGMVSPSARAVFRLTTRSKAVGAWLLDRPVPRLASREELVHVGRGPPGHIGPVGAIRQQATAQRPVGLLPPRGQQTLQRQLGDARLVERGGRARPDKQPIDL